MIRSKRIWGSLIGVAIIAGGIAIAQDHDAGLWRRHPNLAEAERDCHQADQALLRAQQANRWDMHGHAARAEQLLRQADQEIYAAARDTEHR